ncbi:hypothetical protein IJU97_04955 [bacterium]|nr:hypothetical protein [bacterium]
MLHATITTLSANSSRFVPLHPAKVNHVFVGLFSVIAQLSIVYPVGFSISTTQSFNS